MSRRSRGREVALQMLFQREHNAKMERAALEQFARDRIQDEPIRKFCLFLFDGVVEHLAEIDAKISAAAENWRLMRMATVDRNILRLGAFEILFMQDTPAAVAFDEAIELAAMAARSRRRSSTACSIGSSARRIPKRARRTRPSSGDAI